MRKKGKISLYIVIFLSDWYFLFRKKHENQNSKRKKNYYRFTRTYMLFNFDVHKKQHYFIDNL